MSVDSVLTRADVVKVGDHVRERRTGEVREVVEIARTLTERRFILDDGTVFDAMFLDNVHVARQPMSAAEVRSTNTERKEDQ